MAHRTTIARQYTSQPPSLRLLPPPGARTETGAPDEPLDADAPVPGRPAEGPMPEAAASVDLAAIDLAAARSARRTVRPAGDPLSAAPYAWGRDRPRPDEPASGLPRLRVLRPPGWEPDYEDEPGAVVIPFPPRLLPAPDLRLVGVPAEEPDPAEARRRVRRFAMLLAEVLSGGRAPRQLEGHATTEVRARVDRLRRTLAERGVTGVTLAASDATAPTEHTAEGFLRLRLTGPDRFQAVAVRLDRTRPRSRAPQAPTWVCTALRYR